VFTSLTTVNVKKDTAASATIYTATTNEERVTYTLKYGDQKEKFTIDNTTGELKYKEKQTQIETHKVNTTTISRKVNGNRVITLGKL
jgi:hypothetical protein